MRWSRDESGVILSWFLRVGLVLAVIGVVGFDVGSIVVNNFTLDTAAKDVAVAVSIRVEEGGGFVADEVVYDMAVEEVQSEESGVEGARVLRKGTELDDDGVVHVRLRRKADTLVTHLIGPLKKRTVATVDSQAGTN